MLFVVVYNLPRDDFKDMKIERIEKSIKTAVVGISELKLIPEDISFSFPQDPTVVSDTIPVMIIVDLLSEKPERTTEIKQRLAQEIGKAFESAITWRIVSKVEVAVRSFDPERSGFYSK